MDDMRNKEKTAYDHCLKEYRLGVEFLKAKEKHLYELWLQMNCDEHEFEVYEEGRLFCNVDLTPYKCTKCGWVEYENARNKDR